VIDMVAARYLRSVTGLKGVAGALVDEDHDLVFTSNRGEKTVGLFAPDADGDLARVDVGIGPNGLAFASDSGTLLCANVGDPHVPGSTTATLVDVRKRVVLATVPVPGRTRWAVYDPAQSLFFVNIADPPEIVAIDPRAMGVVRHIPVPARGPHGLDIDLSRRRLYCACDEGRLVCLDSDSDVVRGVLELSGAPDVVFLDRIRAHLHVAIGDPGVIDVFDTAEERKVETVSTERGAHTLALDESTHSVYALLPASHRAAVFEEQG
jgi:DNA-binding beta-propeller fold protein YncE